MKLQPQIQRLVEKGLDDFADSELIPFYDGDDDPAFASARAFQQELVRKYPEKAQAQGLLPEPKKAA